MNRGAHGLTQCSRWLALSLALTTALLLATACGGRPARERAARSGGADTAAQTTPGVNDRLLLASAKAALPPPGLTPADLPEPQSEGAQALGQFCTACHNLPAPTIHSATDWPSVLRRMWLRMELLPAGLRVPVPSEEQRQAILNYLLSHALPDPRQHSSVDWPAVVMRMEQRMDQMKVDRPPQAQVSEIIVYLQQASRRATSR